MSRAFLNEWAYYDAWEKRMDAATRTAVREGAKRSAAACLPIIFDHLDTPNAMIEVGAGEGHWSAEAARLGVGTTYALDLESHHDYGLEVYEWNAEAGEVLPLWRGTSRWPLALCLETAEHVTPEAGDHLVRQLCAVADVIVWSAAIPGQGGDRHINEQWPAYWSQRFQAQGFVWEDPWRLDLWADERVEPWYAQNLLYYYAPARMPRGLNEPLALVHPITWSHHRGVPGP